MQSHYTGSPIQHVDMQRTEVYPVSQRKLYCIGEGEQSFPGEYADVRSILSGKRECKGRGEQGEALIRVWGDQGFSGAICEVAITDKAEYIGNKISLQTNFFN